MIGTTVGKYRIVEKLGRGGMGTVYKAIDETLDREVAIKVLNPDLTDPDVLRRFRAEAVTLARLNHPGIATIYELHQQQEELLMVMEFVRGETFHDLSERLGPIAPPQAAHLCMQVLDALGHAHRGGVVHRDLKPANLMIAESGMVKVMDFGIARVLGSERFTQGGYMMGTPAYMAPEQVLGREIDGRADLYSVGVVLYRLMAGRLPFEAETAISMVQMQLSEAPTPIAAVKPDLPAWCSTIVDRALAKSPADRFQSAEELRAALMSAVTPQAMGEMPTIATPAPPGLTFDRDAPFARRLPTPVRTPTAASAAASAAQPVASPAQLPPTIASPPTPGPAPARTSPEKAATTVVLKRTHVVGLAALIVIVAIGIAVLAVTALRRNASPQTVDNSVPSGQTPAGAPASGATTPPGTSATPAPTQPGTPPVLNAPPAGATPTPPAGTPIPPTPPAAAGDKGAAAAGAAAAGTKPAGRGAAVTPGTVPPGSGRSTAPPTAAPEVTPPAAPPVPPAPMVTFNQVRVLVADAGRAREREGVLQLGDGKVAVVASGGAPIMSVPNHTLSAIFYARSKQPKWRDATGKDVESRIDLGPMGFLRGDRNWVILLTGGEPVIMRIEDSALRTVLPALQERTGLTIQR